jgi:hypothetical protein
VDWSNPAERGSTPTQGRRKKTGQRGAADDEPSAAGGEESDGPVEAVGAGGRATQQQGEGRQASGKAVAAVSLSDIIAATLVTPPLRLFRCYKGTDLEATLHGNGTVEFDGKQFATCSAAAEHARSTVAGRPMNTNGWLSGCRRPHPTLHAAGPLGGGRHAGCGR